MLPYGAWILTFASLCGLIQSVIYLPLTIAGGLVYLCVIPVEPYSKPEDFFPVTTVKLYFEGRKCNLSGSYLGKFNEDYKNPDKIELTTPDLIFAFMVAYAILHCVYLITSLLFFYNRNPTTKEGRNRLRDIVLGWSVLSIVISLVDIFLSIEMISDVFSLANYIAKEEDINAKTDKFSQIFFIPLALALISFRVVVIWVWNFLFGLILFCKALSCEKETTTATTITKTTTTDELIEELKEGIEEVPIQKPIYRNHPEWNRFRYSMEAVTPFNEPQDPRWTYYAPSEPTWPPNRFRYKPRRKEEGTTNEGFESDDQDPDSSVKSKVTKKSPKPEDFDHNLKNFEPGEKKIKIVKGKPVSIPVPPPLPAVESYTCMINMKN